MRTRSISWIALAAGVAALVVAILTSTGNTDKADSAAERASIVAEATAVATKISERGRDGGCRIDNALLRISIQLLQREGADSKYKRISCRAFKDFGRILFPDAATPRLPAQGIPGTNGTNGLRGAVGPAGATGERGERGAPGVGQTGPPGDTTAADALARASAADAAASAAAAAKAAESAEAAARAADDPDPDDPEIQDPEIQDPEIQDPEIDDPDPPGPPAIP